MNMIDITPIINAVIALAAAGVSVFLIPWLKSQTTEAQRKELLEWVKIGVAAAEQLYAGQGRGEEKEAVRPRLPEVEGLQGRRGEPATRLSRQQSTSSTRQPAARITEKGGPPARPNLFAKEEKPMTKDIEGIALKPGES